ncbi:MAG TPA: sodium:proton antiporter [Opitutae bacterium]|nr:sodium:proton antiporter [Opitutae bacterium]
MEIDTQFLLTIGGILMLGLVVSALARRLYIPRVTLLLLLGVAIGNGIPENFSKHFEILAEVTLLIVGFLLGGRLTRATLKASVGDVMWISVCAALLAAALVSVGLICLGVSKEMAIILGCIAAATDPAAVYDVVFESKIKGGFSSRLLSIVALDDVWALLLFSVGLSVVSVLNGMSEGSAFIVLATKEIGGGVILGILIGLPAAYLTGRIKPGQPILTEALSIVFICGGLANWLGVSYLIASMVMGAVISNLAKHHEYPFCAIEGIQWPFLIIFFVLAGESLELSFLPEIGLIGCVFILCRVAGKYLGARIGSQISRASAPIQNWMGIALLPQAGVSIGMALVAANQFPDQRQVLLSVIIATTVLFEIIGPIFTRIALKHALDLE